MPRMPRKMKTPRPFIRNAPSHSRPPGLRGREIGLYYRNLSLQKKKEDKVEEQKLIHLRIPQTVLAAIYRCLDKIESIAEAKNIYLPPAKKLDFLLPLNSSDFIPLTSESVDHPVNNIHKIDNDVIFVQNGEPEVIEILDTSFEDGVEKIEKADTDAQSVSKEPGIFVSNNYANTPSTSTSTSGTTTDTETSKEYKYSYDDIITGTFQEKLDECLVKEIEILKTGQETEAMNLKLKENHQLMLTSNEQYNKMLEFRKTLLIGLKFSVLVLSPFLNMGVTIACKKASQLLDVINKNQVVVISGETGCGKSTQVPQLILDEAVANGRGANVKVLVTEPRRIAASSLAARVAQERGEQMGKSVGYAVRLEAVSCRDRGSIMFCTTGVLLVEMELNQALSGYSHVILDEVHERDCHIDLAMCLLKQVLKKRKDLKVILMSATIDADTLSKYYDACPMLHIEGLAYPVKDVYMEDILMFTEFQLPPQRPNFLNQKKSWRQHANRSKVSESEKEFLYKTSINSWLKPLKKRYASSVINQLQDSRIEALNLELVVELLKYICRGEPGAVLVFLPGIAEITKLITLMTNSHAFPPSSHDIYALHSKLPTIDQNKIFQKPPTYKRKIIIATNIAETSITIDDVVYVIDGGKMKYKGLNVEKNFATLQAEWISKANLRQRRGRAGRCQPGICYHLITSYRAEKLDDRLLPEVQRSNLLEEVLCVKRLRLGKAEEALNMMPAVPAEKTIQSAIRHLQQIGALDESETLTPLGWHLARLPVHPAAGKLLVLGALFGCLSRAASVAAVWGFKDPFQMVINKAATVDEKKRNFAQGEPSDHVAMSEAIIQWEQCGDRRSFAYDNFLSNNTLQLLSSMKKQFADNLKQMGFLNVANIESRWENRNKDNLSLFKAIVAASLYPNIATIRWMNQNCRNPNKPIRIKAYTPEDGPVTIHPSSVMAVKMGRGNRQPICSNPGANWLVYWLKQKSTDLFLLDVTCVYTLPLLFFGDLNFSRAENIGECHISISSLKVCCKKETAQLLYQLRSLLDQVLTSKVTELDGSKSKKNFDFDQEVLSAVIDLITAEDEGTQYIEDDDEDDDDFEELPPEQNLEWRND